jgi:transposase InsO family protein
MAFKSESVMDQKREFIRDYLSEEYYFSSLCESYGISRTTGYKLVGQYNGGGFDGLLPRSSRPGVLANSTDELIVAKIVWWRMKKKKNQWGAKKIRVKLVEELGDGETPSVTTIHNILVREGLVVSRKKRRQVKPSFPRFDPERCNEIWSIDYKGHFQLGNGKRCYPFTCCDSYSRYVFVITGQYGETFKGTQSELIKLFREYGQPEYLHSDNGSAFGSIQSPCGYGRLSYWLIDHGVLPVFSDPGRPTQNGRHERMHRDLKAECCRPPNYDLRSQNRSMNKFTVEYNEERPHEGINMQLPALIHEHSLVAYTDKVKPAEYESTYTVRKVSGNGAIRWRSYEWISVSRSLAGKYVGLRQYDDHSYEVYYRGVCIGSFTDGEDVYNGKYYKLESDRDFPHRKRDEQSRSRKNDKG